MAVLTDKQLTAQIRNWRKKKIDSLAYGIRTDQEFSGNPRLEIDGRTYQVAECRSDLEARELLAQAGGNGLVMLFRVGHQRLGEDLLARLAKERLLSVDNVVVCAGQDSLNELMPSEQEVQSHPGWPRFHKIGGAALAAELDAKRAIREGAELAVSF